MKVMLIQAEPPDDIQDFNFPMGYAALDSVLTQAGHEVEILFTVAYHLTEQDIARRIRESRPGVIGIGGMWPYLKRVEMLVQLIRDVAPEVKVVLGGWMVTYLPELVLAKAKPDFCIAGEGEIAFRQLVDALDGNGDPSQIAGVVFRDGGQIVNNGLGECMSLDDLPLPNWEKFPMEYYLRVGWYFNSFCTGYDRVIGWATSRGCPGKCNFCTPGTRIRYKRMDLLMQELHEIEDRFHPTFLYWMDNLTMGSVGHGKRFAQALIDENFKFRYFATGRVDRVDRDMLELLKESGCVCVLYGLESANNGLLRFMGKNTTVEQFVEAVRLTKEVGIGVNISGMFGQPGETLQDFYNTLNLIMTSTDRKMPYSNNQGFYPLTTFPGSPIYHWAKEHGYFKDDEDYYNQFFEHRWLNYTDYPRDVVQQALNVANMLNTWNYHHSKALSLEDSLLYLQAGRSAANPARKMAHRLKAKLDAAPKLKARVKRMVRKSPWLERVARRMLGQHRAPDVGDVATAPPAGVTPAARTPSQPAHDVDPSWSPQTQLDRFIELAIDRYFLSGGNEDLARHVQAGSLTAIAQGFFDRQDYVQAADGFRQVVENDPTDGAAWTSLGWSCQHLGRHDDAEHAFLRALELEAGDVAALRGLAWAKHQKGEHAPAVDLFTQALDRTDSNARDLLQESYRGRGLAHLGLGSAEAAAADLDQAIAHTDADNKALLDELLAARAEAVTAK